MRNKEDKLLQSLLKHASECTMDDCPSKNCCKMKKTILHGRHCKDFLKGCNRCQDIKELLYVHARNCTAKTGICKVPRCEINRLWIQYDLAPLNSATGQKQARLLLVRHATHCKKNVCNEHCVMMKRLLPHLKQCKDSTCQRRFCICTRAALSHYHSCSAKKCNLCARVRSMQGVAVL